jgi:hypothetical protein
MLLIGMHSGAAGYEAGRSTTPGVIAGAIERDQLLAGGEGVQGHVPTLGAPPPAFKTGWGALTHLPPEANRAGHAR